MLTIIPERSLHRNMRQPELSLAGRTLGLEALRRRRLETPRTAAGRIDVRAVARACLDAEPLWPAGQAPAGPAPSARQVFAVQCEVRNLMKQLVRKQETT